MVEEKLPLPSLARMLQSARRPNGMPVSLLAIDGGGGAGKSTLAARLSGLLGDCRIIHTDDFVSWDNFFAWHDRFLDTVLHPLCRNASVTYPRFDWPSGQFANPVTIEPAPWIIIEGVGALHAKFRQFIAFAIFVEAENEIRRQRGLARDGAGSAQFWKEWFAGEKAYFAEHRPSRFADLIVAGNPQIEYDPQSEIVILKNPTAQSFQKQGF